MRKLISAVTNKDMLSRKGKATANEFYEFMKAKTNQREALLPQNRRVQPKVECRRDLTGPSAVTGKKTIDMNLKRVMQINTAGMDSKNFAGFDEDFVSHEEILRHFAETKKRWAHENAAARREAENWGKQAGSKKEKEQLRYVEALQLNRKGHQSFFKSITRRKREHLVDGKNPCLEKTPHAAYYKPKYEFFRRPPVNITMLGK